MRSRPCWTRAISRRWRRSTASRRCSSTPRARPGGRRAWCCRIRAISGCWRCAPTPAPPPGQRVLVAAPLYHMNALSMCQVTLNNGGTIVLLPSFTAAGYIDAASRYQVQALTGVPTMIAMMLREHAAMAAADLAVGAERAHRFGAALRTTDRADAPGAAACPHPARLRHDRGGTGGVRRASDGETPLSVGVAHPAVDLRLRARRRRGGGRRRARDALPRA